MPSSPEVKQSTDATDVAPEDEIQLESDVDTEDVSDDADFDVVDGDDVDLTDPDAWPDAPPVRKRSINAGPGLEIVADAGGAAGPESAEAVVMSDDAEDGQMLAVHEGEDSRGSRSQEQVAAAVAMLLGRVDQGAIDQHRDEYAEPLIWLWRRLVGAAFAFILVSLTWYLIKVPSGLVSDGRIPTQGQVAAGFHELRTNGFAGATLSAHVGISLFRLAVGLGVGAFLGVSIGLVAGAAPLVRTILDPISSFFRTVPGLAAGPLLILWFGIGEAGLLSVVVFSVMWTVVSATADARTEGFRTGSLDVLGVAFAGARSALLLAWATVLAIETVMAPTGLGAMIWYAQGQASLMVAGIAVAGLMGFVLDTLLRTVHYVIVQSGVTFQPAVAVSADLDQQKQLADRGDENGAQQTVMPDLSNGPSTKNPYPLS